MIKAMLRFAMASVFGFGFGMTCLAQQGAVVPLTPLPTAPSGEAILYNGGAIGDNGVGLSPWGGGSVSQDDAISIVTGQHSLRIESPGFYQGGQLTFAEPIAVGDTSDKTRYIELSLKLVPDPKYIVAPTPDINTNPNVPSNSPDNAGDGGRQNSVFYGTSSSLFRLAQDQGPNNQPYRGGPGGPNGPGGGPNSYNQNPAGNQQNGLGAQTEPPPPALPANSLHLIFGMSDGTEVDAIRILPAPQYDQDWITVSLPVYRLRNASTTSPKISFVTICTDNPTFINVGNVKLVTDSTPITASAGGEKDIPVNTSIVFNGKASAGASMLKYEWDFETNGPFVPQAEGPYATHTYTSKGVYTVTLTVTDIDGIKAPAVDTTTVHVEQ
jgi:hypothetical protein